MHDGIKIMTPSAFWTKNPVRHGKIVVPTGYKTHETHRIFVSRSDFPGSVSVVSSYGGPKASVSGELWLFLTLLNAIMIWLFSTLAVPDSCLLSLAKIRLCPGRSIFFKKRRGLGGRLQREINSFLCRWYHLCHFQIKMWLSKVRSTSFQCQFRGHFYILFEGMIYRVG